MRGRCFIMGVLALAPGVAATAAEVTAEWRGDGFDLVLRKDGSGTLSDSEWTPPEPIRWSLEGEVLTIEQDGEQVDYQFTEHGDRLHVEGGDLDQPVDLMLVGGAAGAAPSRAAAAVPDPRTVASGTCASACSHYVACSGDTIDAQFQCVAECAVAGYDSAFLGWFASTDCGTAIVVVQALAAQNHGLQGGGDTGGGGGSSACNGCVWDGSECAWYSQSNWGSNVAYSGAVSTCDAACCGH